MLLKKVIFFVFIGICSVLSQTKPNVIIVITDDQGYGEVAIHGNAIIQTPNMDKLYGQSVRLTDFHVDPTCAPSRAAIMTGNYSRRTGVWHTVAGRSLMRKDQVTAADVFKGAGYRTAMFGKWHLGDNYPLRPQDRGFEHTVIHKGGGVGQGPDYFGNRYNDDHYFVNGVPQQFMGYCTDIWFDEAMKFIELNKDNSFFVYLSTNAPHWPYIVASNYSQPYQGLGLNAAFYGMITNIDENMGYLETKLNELSLTDKTILIFMTDNGSQVQAPHFNAGMRGNKGDEYDGGHRVPFFIRWPDGGLVHGSDVPELTAHIDMLPTLIGLTGINPPNNLIFDGMDVSPWLKGQDIAWPPRTLVVESQRIEFPVRYRVTAVMRDKIRWVNNTELYDITSDPGQATDITSSNSALIGQLQSEYDTWWNDVSRNDSEYVEISMGSRHENPTVLVTHDWHGGGAWDQSHIRNGSSGNGWFAVYVEQAGTYQIEFRRWPVESPGPMEFGTEATLRIGTDEWKASYNSSSDEFVRFQVDLTAGSNRLQGWLTTNRGPYYTYVQRLTGCLDNRYQEYDSTATINDQSLCQTLPVKNNVKSSSMVQIENQKLYIGEAADHVIEIYNIGGEQVMLWKGFGVKTYALSQIKKSGVYLIRVKTNMGEYTENVIFYQW